MQIAYPIPITVFPKKWIHKSDILLPRPESIIIPDNKKAIVTSHVDEFP